MISHETPVICPHCGAEHDLSTGVAQDEKVKPESGSISICIRCHKAAIFTQDLRLRVPTSEEEIQIAANPTIVQLSVLMAGFRPAKGNAS